MKSIRAPMQSGVSVEELSVKYLGELASMMIQLWPDCTYDEEFINCQSLLNSPRQTVLLALSGGKTIGFIQLSLRNDHVEGTMSSPVLYIEGIFIQTQYRNLGLARLLVAKAEEWGSRHGCSEMASDTEVTNIDSIAFHKAIGFEEVNRVVCFTKSIDAGSDGIRRI